MRFRYLLATFLLLLFNLFGVMAQDTEKKEEKAKTSNKRTPQPLLDTVKQAYTLYADTIWLKHDSSLLWFRNQNPHTLQQYGTPFVPMELDWRTKQGVRTGLETGYRDYKNNASNMRLHKSRLPFTDLAYMQVDKDNAFIRAELGHQLDSALYFTVFYSLVNGKGYFNYQESRHENFGIALAYFKKKYSAYWAYTTSKIKQQENWGLTKPTDYTPSTGFISTLPINAKANTEQRNLELNFTQNLSPIKNVDFNHQLTYSRNSWKYVDTATSPLLYPQQYQLDYPKGTRHYIRIISVNNDFFAQFKLKNKYKTSLGLRHKLNFIEQEPTTATVQNLFGIGKIDLVLPLNILFNTQLHVGLAPPNLGDYNLTASATYKHKKYGTLTADFLSQRYQNALIYNAIYINQTPVTTQPDLKKVIEQGLQISYFNPWLKLGLTTKTYNINNFIYLDSSGLVQQLTASTLYQSLGAHHRLQYKKYSLTNQITYQASNHLKYLGLPQFTLQSQFDYQTLLFKKNMLLNLGVAFLFIPSYTSPQYFPLFSSFKEGTTASANQYKLDAYLAFKVKKFRFFINGQNLLPLVTQQQVLTTQNTPLTVANIQWGITWQLAD